METNVAIELDEWQIDKINSFVEEDLRAFTKIMEQRGLFTRCYSQGSVKSLYDAARTIWNHMCALDNGNLPGWAHMAPLANAYSDSLGPGWKRFGSTAVAP